MRKISFRNDVLPLKNALYRLALRITLNRAEAEDIVQDTLIKIWDRRDSWDEIESIEAFSMTVCRNLSLDRYKAARAEKRGGSSFPAALDELSECVPAPGRVEHTLEERELAEAIDRFLRTLPERECSMFLRRYWYVDSVQSIAARYAIKENTAKSILFRTREKLRRYLAGEGIIV